MITKNDLLIDKRVKKLLEVSSRNYKFRTIIQNLLQLFLNFTRKMILK